MILVENGKIIKKIDSFKKIVFADNFKQYCNWVKENNLCSRDYIYANDLHKIRSLENFIIFEIGTYWENKLYEAFCNLYITEKHIDYKYSIT